jgi:hypothetical protein
MEDPDEMLRLLILSLESADAVGQDCGAGEVFRLGADESAHLRFEVGDVGVAPGRRGTLPVGGVSRRGAVVSREAAK